MGAIEIFLGIVLILFAVGLTLVVLFQEGNQKNIGAITGSGSDTFLSKHKSRSIDAFLERWTRTIAIGFFALVVFVNVIFYFRVFGV